MNIEVRPTKSTVAVDDGQTVVVVQPISEAVVVTAPGPQGIPGVPGAPGEKGDKGDKGDGGETLTYTHDQAVASATWTIHHNLNAYIGGVQIVDTAGTAVVGDITYQDGNTLVIQFAAPFAGKAYLS